MELLLPFEISDFPFTASYHDKFFFAGSCFSEEIGHKMQSYKFSVLQNPNGILYDPVSIVAAINSYIRMNEIQENELFHLNGLWHSWKHHSSFSGINKEEVIQKINDSVIAAHHFLKEANLVIITPGTAYHYVLKQNNKAVSNCHKAPSAWFEKQLLTRDIVTSNFLQMTDALTTFNPDVKIIFTISPVRHIKDGLIQNNLSKSRLIDAVHSAISQRENLYYFPSYELVTDVLRDYRFFKPDMVHPNETAINFVFNKFINALLDNDSIKGMEMMKDLLSRMHHKTFHKETQSHQQFLQSTLQYIQQLEQAFPYLNFTQEKNHFQKDVIS
jgi:GSCFA family